MGEMEKSVLRWGGIAGLLAGVVFVISLITFVIGPTTIVAPDESLEPQLVDFPENSARLTVAIDLFVVAFLLVLPFLAALYWSLRETSRVFARIGLGSGILAVVALIFGLQAFLGSANLFSTLYGLVAVSDRPIVVAAYTAAASLITPILAGGSIFIGLAFVAFGLAMRGSPDYQEGFVWLSAVLGLIIILLTFLFLGLVSVILLAALGLVLGWKVYSLSRAA